MIRGLYRTKTRVKLALLTVALGCGCTAAHYRKSADKEAAKVIGQATPVVPNMDTHFTIEARPRLPMETLPVFEASQEYFGESKDLEIGARVLTLEEALGIAVSQSPIYQNRKEAVFIQALTLTLARHRLTPIFFARGNSFYQSSTRDVFQEIDRLAGTQSSLLERDVQVVHQDSITAHGDTGFDVLLRTGARLSTDFTIDFLRFMSSGGQALVSSHLSSTLTQPLLRGSGFKVTLENLTQSERDLLYALRDFTVYRKDFAVQVATSYYRVVQSKDQVRNAWLGVQNFRQNVEREKAFADEGQRTQTALGQLTQAQLSTETQWVNAVRDYRQGLDQFKLLIGLPVDHKIVLDDAELTKLEIAHPKIAPEEAIKLAIETRLDLATVRDRFEDAGRKVGIAKNQLLPDLDLVLNASVDSKPGNNPLNFDFERARWSAGFNTALPLERKAERNNYRASLINYERSGRDVQLAVDQTKLDVQDDWRNLDQARRNYDIAEVGVSLSQRRVEEQELLMELGRGTARDLVDARTDLINARNQRTGALVQHTVARLKFWRDLGVLYIKDNGQWREMDRFEKMSSANPMLLSHK